MPHKPKVATPVKPAAKPVVAAPKVEEVRKPMTHKLGFKVHEFVVYPAHGVGQIQSIEEQEIAGLKLKLFVINFIKDKMTPRPDLEDRQCRHAQTVRSGVVKKALETLNGRARQAHDVVAPRAGVRGQDQLRRHRRDRRGCPRLYRSESQPEQSYSERQLYEAALDRLSREIAAVQQ